MRSILEKPTSQSPVVADSAEKRRMMYSTRMVNIKGRHP